MSDRAPRRAQLPPAIAEGRRALFERLVDPARMLEVLRRELPGLSASPIRVRRCKAKQRRRRVALREDRLEVVYKVRVEVGSGDEREYVLLGTAPETPEAALAVRDALRGHPALAPFELAALHVPAHELVLRFFPLDPALPALAELTGPRGAALLSAHLPECREGARLEALECELRQYKPFKRAVLRLVARLSGGRSRALYAKLFADKRGATTYAELRPLWLATREARALRLPEPIGYDAGLRMLLLAEAPGQRDLSEWLKCLEKGAPLPDGVDLARLERCVTVAAQAAADLRHSGVRPRRTRTFADELAGLRRDLETLRPRLAPEALSDAERLVGELAARAPERDELVPVHGCFRHKQMVGDESALAVIDWDGLCLGQPGLDAATFLCRLTRKLGGSSSDDRALGALADRFRAEFVARAGVSRQELAFREALMLTQEMLRAFRRPGDEDESDFQVQRMASQAFRSLDLAAGLRDR